MIIVSHEARLSTAEVAEAIRQRLGVDAGAKRIGEQEVEPEEALWRDLGVRFSFEILL